MTTPRRRARSAGDKQLRRRAILDAARELALDGGARLVTLTNLTARAGLHPSALRRYFDSRDEVLLELAQEGWGEWRTAVESVLAGRQRLTAAEIGELLTISLERVPLFCDLLTHSGMSLEGAVELARLRAYKQAANEAFDAMITALAQASADLDRAGCYLVLATAMSTAAFQYQLSRPAPVLARLYAQEPRWAHDALRFHEHVAATLIAVAAGASAVPPVAPRPELQPLVSITAEHGAQET